MALARDYELGIIVNPDVGDEQARAIVERVTQTIATQDGQVVRVNAQGRRRLAYPIDHHRDGLYFYFDMMLPPQAVNELERTLRVNEDIVRHLLLARDPRAVAQQRQRDAEADAQAAVLAAAQATQAAQAAQSARPPVDLEPVAEPAPAVATAAVAEESQPAAVESAAEPQVAVSDEAVSDEDEGDAAETTATEAEANA